MYRTICLVLKGQNVPYDFQKVPRMYTYLYLLSEELTEPQIEKLAQKRQEEESRLLPENQKWT